MSRIVDRIAFAVIGALALALVAVLAGLADAGPLDPTDPPASTDSVKLPGTPISALPYTISTPGNYYLTRNLTGTSGQDGIIVAANDVRIDLNGFTLAGVPGSDDGIATDGFSYPLVVENGTVRGWGGDGIDANSTTNGRFEDLALLFNAGSGLRAGFHGTLTNIVSRANGGAGVVVHSRNVMTNLIVEGNQGGGIIGFEENVLSGCSAAGNIGDGINFFQANITGCRAERNTGDGIEVRSDSFISGNTARNNGLGGNDGAGIHTLQNRNRIEGNTVTGNDRGIDVDVSGSVIVKNSAGANTVEFDIAANNDVGPIDSGAAGVLDATSPWANIDY